MSWEWSDMMGKERDTIVLLGLNKTGAHEAKALREKGNKVIYIGPGGTAGSVKVGKTAYKLTTHKEVAVFVKSLGLDAAHEKKAISAIRSADLDIRDELAQLAVFWSGVQKKGNGATRFIISSHSSGGYFWGEKNGFFTLNNISKLAEAMPKAVGVIEDLHLSACYSGKKKDLEKWQKIFPGVHTIWAYSGSAPGAHSGATLHMSLWDSATRDNKYELDRSIAKNTRKGKEVAVWSRRFGYKKKSSTDIISLMGRIRRAESTYISYFNGSRAVIVTSSGPLRDYYNDLQELSNHPHASTEQVNKYESRRETTLRLIYFNKKIRKQFSQYHAKLIKSGYEKIGLKAPVFSRLNRKDTMRYIDNFLSKYKAIKEKTPEIDKLKDELINGLRDLKVSHIPASWI